MSKMSGLSSLEKVLGSKELLYTLLLLSVILPILHPLGIPVEISQRTRDVYGYIEKNLRSGCRVYIEVYYEVAARGELEPNLIALTKHLFDKGCKIVYGSLGAFGVVAFSLFKSMASDLFEGKEYGRDYVYLGYIAGGEAASASLAKSIKGTISVDNYGNRLEDLPLMREVDKATDFDLVIIVSSGTDVFSYYVRQWHTPYGVPLLFAALSVIAPSIEPFVGAKQAVGMLVGQRSAAEYEVLVGRLGLGIASMDAQSTSHMLIVAFIIIGNAIYWGKRVSSKKGGSK
ncbi:MAG: hypothetical protein QXY48_03810 [Sulfolobales archaeon]